MFLTTTVLLSLNEIIHGKVPGVEWALRKYSLKQKKKKTNNQEEKAILEIPFCLIKECLN